MFANFKDVITGERGRRRKEAVRRQQKMHEQHIAFEQYEDFMERRRARMSKPTFVPVNPQAWPSRFHHSCDFEFCGYPNKPQTRPGSYRCSSKGCLGNYEVTPEQAASNALYLEFEDRKMLHRERMREVGVADKSLLRSSGRSAMDSRRRLQSPSLSSVATAPTLVHFPSVCDRDPPPFKPNPLHPNATSTKRPLRPSLPLTCPPPDSTWCVSLPSPRIPSLITFISFRI
ncbi:hypothetical protein R3P38DRAFT_2921936 [Favolaschia claudopus]|uniref:Uncharacterized protein n=1 Tax=Favolaschia claudopus TaxID=2862362 RepID=A0AAW0C316_9AGAR